MELALSKDAKIDCIWHLSSGGEFFNSAIINHTDYLVIHSNYAGVRDSQDCRPFRTILNASSIYIYIHVYNQRCAKLST